MAGVSSFDAISSGAQIRIKVTPDPAKFAKSLQEKADAKALKKEIGKSHKRLSDKPIKEIKSRANAMGSGRVRIGRAVKSSASSTALTVRGGKGYPDFAGQEYGSLQYRRFLPWKGNGDSAGYVIGELLRDDAWMTQFGEEYVDEIDKLYQRVFT